MWFDTAPLTRHGQNSHWHAIISVTLSYPPLSHELADWDRNLSDRLLPMLYYNKYIRATKHYSNINPKFSKIRSLVLPGRALQYSVLFSVEIIWSLSSSKYWAYQVPESQIVVNTKVISKTVVQVFQQWFSLGSEYWHNCIVNVQYVPCI